MKRIALMMYRLDCGGVERALVDLLGHIDPQRYSVDLLFLEKEGAFLEKLPAHVRKIQLPLSEVEKVLIRETEIRPAVRRGLARGKWLHTAALLLRYVKCRLSHTPAAAYVAAFGRIKPLEYDIVLDFHGYASATTYFLAEKVKAEKKYTWVHGEGCVSDFSSIDVYLKKYREIFCVSEELCRRVKELYPQYPPEKVTVFKNFIQHREIVEKGSAGPALPKQDGVPVLLTVGRIAYEKGYELLVDAAAELVRKGCVFHWFICGEGPWEQRIRNRISESGLDETITILGYSENPYSLMKSCDLYVQTSISEGYGITVVEAMLLGCVTVSTPIPAAKDVIVPGQNGAIAQMDAGSMAEAIYELLQNPDLMCRMRHRQIDYEQINRRSVEKLQRVLGE